MHTVFVLHACVRDAKSARDVRMPCKLVESKASRSGVTKSARSPQPEPSSSTALSRSNSAWSQRKFASTADAAQTAATHGESQDVGFEPTYIVSPLHPVP